VWKSSTEVGFGVSSYLDGTWKCYNAVANYKSHGNYVGQYTANVFKE
jgi:hypothetical protein